VIYLRFPESTELSRECERRAACCAAEGGLKNESGSLRSRNGTVLGLAEFG